MKHPGLLELFVGLIHRIWWQQRLWEQSCGDLVPEATDDSKLVDGILAAAGDDASVGLPPASQRQRPLLVRRQKPALS